MCHGKGLNFPLSEGLLLVAISKTSGTSDGSWTIEWAMAFRRSCLTNQLGQPL